MRGKDTDKGDVVINDSGSPPLARERQAGDDALKKQARITPACAGKTVMDPFVLAACESRLLKISLVSAPVDVSQ